MRCASFDGFAPSIDRCARLARVLPRGGREVRVVLIGRKRGNVLRVDGLRFAL